MKEKMKRNEQIYETLEHPSPRALGQPIKREYIAKGTFKTKSEFIRAAVRDRLEVEQKKG